MAASRLVRGVMCIAALAMFQSQAFAQTVEDRTQDKVAFPAFKIMGNLYYVGTGTLNSFLISTPQGAILINTNFEDTIPLLKASIEKVGFKMTDVKMILGSHAHPDHQQADATVKEMTGGAPVVAMEEDVAALKNITAPDKKPHPIDRVIHDGDKVTLGNTTLTAHLTPGHTRGCTTWTLPVTDAGKTYNVMIACGGLQEDAKLIGNKNYPDIAADWAKAIKYYESTTPDVFLAAHSWFFDLKGKYDKMATAKTNPYIDPAGYKAWVADMHKRYNELLKSPAPTN
jgi:metallo-beta-lactamase class B